MVQAKLLPDSYFQMTYPDDPHVEELVQEARKVIAFEDDPHNAGFSDNPESVKVNWGTWAAVFVSKALILVVSS